MSGKKKPTRPDLMDVLFDGLAPLTVRGLRHVYKAFATFCESASTEAALQALIRLDRDQAIALLARFKTQEIERGISHATATQWVVLIRTVVRKAKKAGLTTLDLGRPSEKHAPGSLMAIILRGLKPVTAAQRLRACNAFAAFREAASAEAALQSLIEMEHDEVLAVLDVFEAHELKRGLSPISATERVGMIKTSVRKAHAAGLTQLNLDSPPVEYAPGSLMAILFDGLSPLSAQTQKLVYKYFAAFREAASAEAALQELIHMDDDNAIDMLRKFYQHEIDRGISKATAENWVGLIRTAVRKAGAASLTPLRIKVRRKFRSVEYAPGSLMAILFDGLKPVSARVLLNVYKYFAAFLKAASVEAALQELIHMDDVQRRAMIDRFEAHELKRGLSPETVRHWTTSIRTAVRKAHAGGFTPHDFDRKRKGGPRLKPSGGSQRHALAEARRPQSRNADRDDFCIERRDQGDSYREIVRQVELRTDWVPLAGKQAVRDAIKRRCNALGRPVPRVADDG
jgi:hypothetical protein